MNGGDFGWALGLKRAIVEANGGGYGMGLAYARDMIRPPAPAASGRRVPDTCTVPEMGLYCATSFLPALRHIRQWKPDVVHAHFAVPTGALAWAVSGLTGVPYVLTAHLGDVPGGVPDQTDTLTTTRSQTTPARHTSAFRRLSFIVRPAPSGRA